MTKRTPKVSRTLAAAIADVPVVAAPTPKPQAEPTPEPTLLEMVVDYLVEHDGARNEVIAPAIGSTAPEVREVLLDLEQVGMVYRTGKTRGTRWWLG